MKAYRHKVQYYETDKMGIVHHSNYIRWMEEARIFFFEQIGWNYDKLEAEGILSPVTAVECKYKANTFFPDSIEIVAVVEEFSGVRLKLRYEMKKTDGTLVCEGRSEHCFVNREGKILRLKKERPELCAVLAELVKADDKTGSCI